MEANKKREILEQSNVFINISTIQTKPFSKALL